MSAGILIIAHSPLATALRDCASHVYAGRLNRLEALDVPVDVTPDAFLPPAYAALQRVQDDGGVLILVDVSGATPGNLAQRLANAAGSIPTRVVSGVNLPMVLRSICYQEEPLDALAARAIEGGQRAITELHPDQIPEAPTC